MRHAQAPLPLSLSCSYLFIFCWGRPSILGFFAYLTPRGFTRLKSVSALYEVTRFAVTARSSYLHNTQTPPRSSKNLALDTTSRDSFRSCPDLTSLQISQSPISADGFDQEINTEPSRSPSPDSLAPRGTKKRSNRQAVSRKARGVIGKVRALQRIAAAKMAHPSIKIDTNIQSTKRGLPDSDVGPELSEQGNPRLEDGNTEDVPPFLCQSVTGE